MLRGAGVDDLELVPRPDGVPDVDETGTTLEDNARLKAVALCEATGLPAIADDTGLARRRARRRSRCAFGAVRGRGRDRRRQRGEAARRCCATSTRGRRTARFATVALARFPDGREVAAFGDVEGTIATEPRGEAGFGYDPVFVPDEGDGRTFAQMHGGAQELRLAPGPRVPYPGRRPSNGRGPGGTAVTMAVIDIAGFVADLKDHAVEHGFHVHDERHFVESYSLRQNWEVDLHPEEGCEGPVDLYLSLEIDPRVLLGFEDAVIERADVEDPPDEFHFPLNFTWALPPLPHGPDLLVLATELAGRGGPDLPLEVSAIDSIPEITDAPERSLRIVAHQSVSVLHIRDGDAVSCEVLDRCLEVSRYLLNEAGDWLG